MGTIAAFYTDDERKVEFRDMILDNGILPNLFKAVQMERSDPRPDLNILRLSADALFNIFREKTNSLDWAKISPSIPILKALLKFNDDTLLESTTWVLAHISSHPNMDRLELSTLSKPMNDIANATESLMVTNNCRLFAIRIDTK